MDTKFKIGDKVNHTNDAGIIFTGKTITGIETINGKTRYYITPTDTPWYSKRETSLSLASEPLPKHYVGYCVNCGEGHHLENGLCQNCRPISPAAQAIIKPEWDAMQDFITQMGERLQGGE